MTASIVIAVLQMVRLREQPTASRWIAAVLATGWAAFVKPMSVFFTVPCAVVLQLAATDTRTWKQMFGAGRKLLAFVVVAAVPSAVHYLHGMALGAFDDETRGRFLPHLLATEFFWQGWWRQLVTVAPAWTWMLATLAPFVAAPGIPKQVVTGLSIGYLLLVAGFPYHAATHDYYHLPALVIVALALAVLAPRLQRVARPPRTLRVLLAGAVVVLAVVWLQQSLEEIRRRDRSAEVEIYERIGALVSHSRRTVLLAYDYGSPLRYHGHFAGRVWPSRDDLFASSVGAGSGGGQGAWSSDVPNAQQRFEEFYLPHSPEYFIITDFDSFDAQPDLKQFLDSNFRQMVADHAFTIYDLRAEVATR
jgi:hypothetical protein